MAPSLFPLPGPPPLPGLPKLEGLWAQSWQPFSTTLTPWGISLPNPKAYRPLNPTDCSLTTESKPGHSSCLQSHDWWPPTLLGKPPTTLCLHIPGSMLNAATETSRERGSHTASLLGLRPSDVSLPLSKILPPAERPQVSAPGGLSTRLTLLLPGPIHTGLWAVFQQAPCVPSPGLCPVYTQRVLPLPWESSVLLGLLNVICSNKTTGPFSFAPTGYALHHSPWPHPGCCLFLISCLLPVPPHENVSSVWTVLC